MKTILHPAAERGTVNFGWLNSHHSFSFGPYYDPSRMGFGLLRVLNDDVVAPGMGFGEHPHDNMEIISIPLSGALEHKDSTGTNEVIRSAEVQIMSAGTGIRHSEYNHSKTEAVSFLQIWVFPKVRNIAPRYEQKLFAATDRQNKLKVVVSPDQNDDALWINQDAWFSLGSLEAQRKLEYLANKAGNGVYVFVIKGEVQISNQILSERDAMGITDFEKIEILANKSAEVLLIEVPMD